MYKKATLLSLLGFAAGVLIGLAVMLLYGGKDNIAAELPRLLLGGIPGALAMGGSVVYGIEKWGVFRATLTHFLLTMGALCIGAFALNWFGSDRTAYWLMMAVCVIAYFVVWLALSFTYKKQIRRMNEELRKIRGEHTP